MIIFDTSVWIDHFRKPVSILTEAIRAKTAIMHPFVLGELAAGTFTDWSKAIAQLKTFPLISAVTEEVYLATLEEQKLMGTGLSFVDIHLVAAARTNEGSRLFAHDKRLMMHAEKMGCAFRP